MKNVIKWILFSILCAFAAVGVWTVWVTRYMIYALVFSGGIH